MSGEKALGDKPKTAWVLSGGGAAGSVQMGIMKALHQAPEFRPDLIVGTSAGAMNAFGYSKIGITGLESLWYTIKKESDVFGSNFPPYISAAWRNGMKNISPLRKKLEPYKRAPANVPFYVCTTNLSRERASFFSGDSPDIVDYTCASASMEGYVEPILIHGDWHGDGGAIENVPLKAAVELGAERIFVLMCHPYTAGTDDDWEPQNTFDVLARTYRIRSRELVRGDLVNLTAKGYDIRVISPRLVVVDTLDFEMIPQGVTYGKSVGDEFLSQAF